MNSEDRQEDLSRIELFEALGHPMRVKIIEALNVSPLGFADLKRKVGIESSGHLSFHLNKLGNLVRIDSEGNYSLTDDGREALRLLDAVGEAKYQAYHSPTNVKEWWKENRKVVAIAIIVIVIAALSFYSISSFSSQQYWKDAKNEQFRENAMWIQGNLEYGVTNLGLNNTYDAVYFINQATGRLYLLWDAGSLSDSYSLFIGYTMGDFGNINDAMRVVGQRIYYGNYTEADLLFVNESSNVFEYFWQSIPMNGSNGYTLANFDTNVANFHNLASMARDIIND